MQARTLALAGIVGPVLFTGLVVLQGFLQPDYSHVRLPISALAAWPTGWIQNTNFFVTGGLLMAFAITLHRAVRPARQGRLGFPLLFVSAIALVCTGLFPWRMIDGIPTETAPHVAMAITVFGATGFGLVAFSRRMTRDPSWRHLAAYTMATGIVVLLLFIAVGFFAVGDGTPLHEWAGLLQRVLCAVWFAWLIVLSLRLRTV